MKKSGRSFRLMENHLEITGACDPLSWGDVWRKVKRIERGKELKMCSHVDPFLAININLRTKRDDARILRNLDNRYYKGAALGQLFQKLFASIKKEGVLTPVWAYTLPEDHEYWRKRKKQYNPKAYVVEDGRHRTVVCQFWDILVPAFILVAQ